jgi:hypothetical protein
MNVVDVPALVIVSTASPPLKIVLPVTVSPLFKLNVCTVEVEVVVPTVVATSVLLKALKRFARSAV